MVDIENTVNLLKRIPLFRGLKRRQLERLANKFVERAYDADATIVEQGKGGEGFFIIISGQAEVIHLRSDDSRVVLNPLGPAEFFGELALLTNTMRTASVVATDQVNCLVLTRWDFLGLLKDDAEMSVTVLQELAERFSRVLNTL